MRLKEKDDMIDQAGIMMAQGLGTASERIQGVNDNMSQSHYHEYFEIYYLEAGERFHMVEDQLYHMRVYDLSTICDAPFLRGEECPI